MYLGEKLLSKYLLNFTIMRNNFRFCVVGGYIFVLLFIFINGEEISSQSPHIIFIYADDLGWNDVSFHGSPQIPTPNIDALAMNGILLNNYYGEYMCTPSRAALLTGKYPIRLGLQHFIIKAGEASGLPLEEITMPQYLKQFGYISHMIGKWHLGYMKKEYTPIYRGFDTFFGYYNGILDYYDYTSQIITHFPNFPWFRGIDLHNGTTVIKDFRGQYATYVFTDKAKDIILSHDQSKPLFLYLSHLAVHAGNKNDPLQAPPEIIQKFKYIKDINRRIHAAMVSVLDESVGTIIKALHSRNMLQNSIIVFASDNGGQVNGLKGGYSSNYPLRGKKMTLWEGGVRVPAIIWSPLLKLKTSQISDQLMHVSDWLPTFYSAAGGDVKKLGNIDGKSMWKAFIDNLPSPRVELLHSVDSIDGISAIRRGDWKVVNGSSPEGYDDWYGPTGTEDMEVPKSMEEWVFKNGSVTGNILRRANLWIAEDIDKWYKLSQVTCDDSEILNTDICLPVQKPKLFNIKNDPCEKIDLASIHPEMVNSMMLAISAYGESAVESQSKPSDPLANPMCYEFAHVPWLDSEYASQYKNCDVWQ